MESKPWYQSKTMWLNILALVGMVVPKVGEFYKDNPDVIISGLAVANAILRAITGKRLEIQ